MANKEVLSDALTVDDYIHQTVQAENSAWSNAAGADFPDIDMAMIDDEETRNKVLILITQLETTSP